jgi:PKD repeat protein
MEGLGHTISRAATLLVAVAALAAVISIGVVAAAVQPAAAQVAAPPPPPDIAPVASFTNDPAAPLVGQVVTFTSTSTDVDGTIAHEAWDLDGDGVNDATGHTATWVYTQPGPHTVRLRVRDNAGVVTPVRRVVVVTAPNRAPVAAFSYAPAAPVAASPITFTSSSSDPDGGAPAITWDLDHDGSFDDAAGPGATWTFPAAGSYVVALRATDSQNASTVALQTVTVRGADPAQDAPAAPRPGNSAPGASPLGPTPSPGTLPLAGSAAPGTPATPARMISPFPVVRIRGRASGNGVVIELLSVRGPRGASVLARCHTAGCPRRGLTARAVSAVRIVRLRAFERRYAPGAVVEVYVTMPGRIGKYVRFTIRRGRAPGRTDRCVGPGGTQPIRCPAT